MQSDQLTPAPIKWVVSEDGKVENGEVVTAASCNQAENVGLYFVAGSGPEVDEEHVALPATPSSLISFSPADREVLGLSLPRDPKKSPGAISCNSPCIKMESPESKNFLLARTSLHVNGSRAHHGGLHDMSGSKATSTPRVLHSYSALAVSKQMKLAKQQRDRRKPNFTQEEVEVILSEIKKNVKGLLGKGQWRLGKYGRMKIWQNIARKVNALGYSRRSEVDIRKKWYDLHRTANKSIAERLRQLRMAAGKSPTSKVASAHEDLEEEPLDLPPLSDVDTAEEGDPPMAVWLDEDKPELTPGSAEDLQIKMEIEEPGAGAASVDTPGRQSFHLRGCQVVVEVLESEKERSVEAEVFGRPKDPSQMCKEEELFSCPYCRASFAGEPFLEEHLKTRHPKTLGSAPVLPLGPSTQELCDSSSSCSSSSWSDAQSDWRRWKMLMRSRDKRKPNFTENEVDIIIAEVKKNAKVLFNREKQWNMRDKMKVWQDIAIKVSALGQSRRSRKEVKKKWYDLKRNPREGLAEWLRAQGWGSEKVREPPVERSVASSTEPALAEGASVAEVNERPEEEGHDEPPVPTEEQESDHPEQEICCAPESLLQREDAQSPVTDSAPSDLSNGTSGLLAVVEQLLKAQQETNAKLDSLTETVRCGFADFSGVGHNGLAGSVGSMERSVAEVSRCLAQIERKMDVWTEKMSQAQAEQMKVIENVTATLNLVATQLALVAPSRVSPCPTKPQQSSSDLES